MARARLDATRELDKFEQEKADFFAATRNEYLRRAAQFPQRFRIIDSTRSIAAIQARSLPSLTPCWPLSDERQYLPVAASGVAAVANAAQRMPHAILFHGAAGIGKSDFIERFAQSLLCEAVLPDGHACGQCASCGWFLQANHPDYRRVRPEALEDDLPAEGEGEGEAKKTAKSKDPSRKSRSSRSAIWPIS
jgi:hypothetical protein